jgi:hypothetical protein
MTDPETLAIRQPVEHARQQAASCPSLEQCQAMATHHRQQYEIMRRRVEECYRMIAEVYEEEVRRRGG